MTHPLGRKQSLHEVGISLLERYKSDKDYNFFLFIDLELAKMTLNQNHDTPLGVSILISLSKFKFL